MNPETDLSRTPFSLWAEERLAGVVRFDNQRLDAVPIRERRANLPATGPELAWSARRRHAPCRRRVGPSAPLDCHYLRLEEEGGYAGRLSQLLLAPPDLQGAIVSWSLLCFQSPFAPHQWPRLSRVTDFPLREFPLSGLVHVANEAHARDSAYGLYLSSTAAGHGDPGRFLAEYRKEAKARRRGWLVAWNQVEYYQLYPASRVGLYPQIPPDWAQWEVPTNMSVPLPPVVAYAGSGLITGNSVVGGIFFSEWTVSVFARWVTDGHHRGLLWRLPPKVWAGVRQLGIAPLLQGSPYHLSRVDELLRLHDQVAWDSPALLSSHPGVVPIQLSAGRFQPLMTPVSPSHSMAFGRDADDDEEELLAEGGRDSEIPGTGRLGISLRSCPAPVVAAAPLALYRPPSPARDSNILGSAGRDTPERLPLGGVHWELDLSATRLEDWLSHLGIYEALNPYFPAGPMREEDIARAYAQLLTTQDSLRLQGARAERREAEGQGQVVQLNIERETTRRELERLQEDLAVIMGRLSLGKREKG